MCQCKVICSNRTLSLMFGCKVSQRCTSTMWTVSFAQKWDTLEDAKSRFCVPVVARFWTARQSPLQTVIRSVITLNLRVISCPSASSPCPTSRDGWFLHTVHGTALLYPECLLGFNELSIDRNRVPPYLYGGSPYGPATLIVGSCWALHPGKTRCTAGWWPWTPHSIAQSHLNIVHHQTNGRKRRRSSLKSD